MLKLTSRQPLTQFGMSLLRQGGIFHSTQNRTISRLGNKQCSANSSHKRRTTYDLSFRHERALSRGGPGASPPYSILVCEVRSRKRSRDRLPQSRRMPLTPGGTKSLSSIRAAARHIAVSLPIGAAAGKYRLPSLPFRNSRSIMADRSNPFTIHCLPYGVISTPGNSVRRCATAYGDWAVDLSALYEQRLFSGIPGLEQNVFASVG